jgi:Bacterial Ig-like domain (group 3)
MATLVTVFGPTRAAASGPQALILGATVSGAPSVEQTSLENQGWTVTVADDATWGAMSRPQFAVYQLLVFGDPTCGGDPSIQAAAVGNESTWAPVVNGNVIVMGTDPVFHLMVGEAGAGALIDHALAYAGAQPGRTGAYVDLSCYYNDGSNDAQNSPLLDGLEPGFTMYSENNCSASIHVAAAAQQLIGVTDAELSNWGCSVHEFFGTWPSDFVPYAIDTAATGTPASGICPNPAYQAPDGSTPGCPYIVGRGGGLTAGTIGLTGPAAAGAINTSQMLTASVEQSGSPVAGAVVTLTDVSGPNAGATATVTTDAGGIATHSYSSTSAGTDEWTATYTPSGGSLETSNQAPVIWKLLSSFTASATPASVAYGTTSTLADIGLPGPATGAVTFVSGATWLCTATLPATGCTTSTTLNGGTYAITATYSGDGTYAGSTASTSLVVTPADTSFTAAATPASVAFGTPATLAETGLPGDATGTVAFTSGASTLCTATLPATGCATSTTLFVGSYPIIATYSGDGNYSGSTASTALTVTIATSSFTASATPPTVPFGTPAALGETGLPGVATGTVTFTSGALTLCTATLPATGCTTASTLAVADYPIVATYSGDGNLTGSSATTDLTVTLAPTSFSASATAASIVYGTSSTLAESGLPGAATGTVTFRSGGSTLCSTLLPTTSCVTSTSLGGGTYAITATYSGDGSFAASTAATSLTVTRAPTVIVASAAPASVPFGATSSLRVSGLPVGATGTITFRSAGMTLCTAMLPATSCTVSTVLGVGVHPITASYSGDGNYAGSTAATSLTVTPAATTTRVLSSQNPALPNQRIVYVASVLSNPGSGTVTFSADGAPIAGCVAVPTDPFTGVAICSTSYPTPGTHVIAAMFNGNANFMSSTSPRSGLLALTEVVDAPISVPATGSDAGAIAGRALVGIGVLSVLGLLMAGAGRRRRRAS